MNVVAAVGVVAVFWGAAGFLAYLALSGLGVHEQACGRVLVLATPGWRRYRAYCRLSRLERRVWRAAGRAAAPMPRNALGHWVGAHAAA